MPEMRVGDVAQYEQCQDRDCPAHREGFEHAHLIEVRRADDTATTQRDNSWRL